MVDMLNAAAHSGEKSNPVMNIINSKQCRRANPVTYPGIEHTSPHSFIPGRIRGTQTDVAKTGDACITAWEITPSTDVRTPGQLNFVPGQVMKADETMYKPLLTLFLSPLMHRKARSFKR